MKSEKNSRKPNSTPFHSSFSGGIICGPHRGSFAVRDHLRSNLGIISGLGIIISGAVQSSSFLECFGRQSLNLIG